LFDLARLSAAARAVAPLAAVAEKAVLEGKGDVSRPDDTSVSLENLERAGVPRGRAKCLADSWSAYQTILSKLTAGTLLDGFCFVSRMHVQGNHLCVPFLCEAVVGCPSDQDDRLLKYVHSGYVTLQGTNGAWVDATTVPWLEGGHERAFDGRGKNVVHPALSTTIALLCLTAPRDLPWLKSVVKMELKRK
jgi:hypothetical protein